VLAVFLTWFATQHPIIAGLIAFAFVVGIVFVIRIVIKAMRNLFRNTWEERERLEART
jgi:hypothetical protein